MIHTLITGLILYCLFRAAIRPRKPDPMAGRLVHRSASMSAARLQSAIETAPSPCPYAAAWHAEQARLDMIDALKN
jgi:hypothetical protein